MDFGEDTVLDLKVDNDGRGRGSMSKEKHGR